MSTRPDAHREALTRRLALLRADVSTDEWPGEWPDEPAAPPPVAGGEGGWWAAHTGVPEEPGDAVPRVEPPTGPPFPAPAPVVPVALPVPGRHAARRRLIHALGLPEALHGRARLGPAQLSVVALVVAAALALTCWWLARGKATTLAPPAPASSAAPPLVALETPAADTPAADTRPEPPRADASPSAAAQPSTAMVTVDVEGKVRHPGIVILPTGSRVTDALQAAGGVPRRRALGGLNLAAVLVDGQQIVVGAATPAGAPAADTGSATAGAAGAAGTATTDGAPVNLNTATAEQLDTLPDVGPVTAQSILEWREQNGGFTSVQELLEVDGIGPVTLEKIAPHATV